jgi:N-acetylmuramoyl-L-alanine amidase
MSRMDLVYRPLFFLLLSSLLCVTQVGADSYKESVDGLVAQLRSLRNTDVQYERNADWKRLSERFRKTFETIPSGDSKSRAAFYYAVVEREIGERTENTQKIRAAAELFEDMSRADVEHPLADDALHSAYIIYRDVLKEPRVVERIRSEFVSRFPRSELVFMLDSAPLEPSEEAEEPVEKSSEKPLIFIDPGHGGEDEGAVGVAGIREKDLVLTLAKGVEKELLKSGCCRVVLSRDSDAFIPLFERTASANRLGAKLFVSLHVNAHEENAARARGFEVYYVSNESNPKAIELVSRENRQMHDSKGVGMETFLSELYWRGAIKISQPFANRMYATLKEKLPPESDGMKIVGRGVHSAPFFVLFGAEMPAILLELFFATHPDDAFLLSMPKFRHQVVKAIVAGITAELEGDRQ